MVVVAGPVVARVIAGDDFGGSQSSGELRAEGTASEAARARHQQALRGVGIKRGTTAGPLSGRGHVGGEHRRRRVRS